MNRVAVVFAIVIFTSLVGLPWAQVVSSSPAGSGSVAWDWVDDGQTARDYTAAGFGEHAVTIAWESIEGAADAAEGPESLYDQALEWIRTLAEWAVLGVVLFLGVAWYYRLRAALLRTRGPLRLFDLVPFLSPRVAIEPFDATLTGEQRGEAFASRIRYEMKFLDASTHRASVFLSAGADAASNLTSDLEKLGEESKLAAAALSILQRLLPREQWHATGSLGADPRPNATALLRRGSHVVAGLTLELPARISGGKDGEPDAAEVDADYRAMARGVAAWISHHMAHQLGTAGPRKWGRLLLWGLLEVGAVSLVLQPTLGWLVAIVAAVDLIVVISVLGEIRTRNLAKGWAKTSVYYRAASAAFLHTGLALNDVSKDATTMNQRHRLLRDAQQMFRKAHQTDLTNLTASYSIGYQLLRTQDDDEEAARIFKRVIDATAGSEELAAYKYDLLRPQALYNRYVALLHVVRQVTGVNEFHTGAEYGSARIGAAGQQLTAAKESLGEALTWVNGPVADHKDAPKDATCIRASRTAPIRKRIATRSRMLRRSLLEPGFKGADEFARRTLPVLKTAMADLDATERLVRVRSGSDELTQSDYESLDEEYKKLRGRLEECALAGEEVHMAYYNLACRNATLISVFDAIEDSPEHPTHKDKRFISDTKKSLLKEALEMLRRALVEATEFRSRLARWADKDPCLKPIRDEPEMVQLLSEELLR